MPANVAYRAIGLAAGLVLAALLVQQLITLLLAVVVMLIISLPLSAAADMGERRGIPRAFGAVGGLLAALAGLVALGYAIIPSFVSQAQQFANALPNTITRAERYLHGATGVTTRKLSAALTGFVQGYTHHPQRLIAPLESVGLSVAAILTSAVVVLITALYVAIAPDPLLNGPLRLLPAARRADARAVMGRVRTAWLGWLRAMAIDMLLLGGLLYLGMRIVGLEFAVGFAVFSAVLTVIPNFGSIISAVPPVLLGLSHSPGKAGLVLVVYVIVNQIEGNLILPLVMARTVDLHPALVAIGVLVMAQLFGLIGVIVAIPLLSLVIILVEELWVKPQEAAGFEVVGAGARVSRD
ncbi:MAG: AI-2E family transporter [Solirubrobacteraceae bacterium]